jgi:nitrogen fixation protein NifB
MRLAFASNDGVFVSQHFGHSRRFVIADIDEKSYEYSFVGSRENDAPCNSGRHDEAAFENSLSLLGDCKVLFAAQIGNYAKQRLQLQGVQALEKPGFIEELLAEYIKFMQRPLFGTLKRRKIMDDHPCFSARAHNARGRLHLPVSPVCNIQCRFCAGPGNTGKNRPGAAAKLLKPDEAVGVVKKALELCPEISVIGIAGPGDALASEHAMETFRHVHAAYPELIKCLSTNGLELPGKARELWAAGVRTITVTVNAVSVTVLEKVVSRIKEDRDLIAAQVTGIRECAETGMIVKVNTVLIPGINDAQIGEIARTVGNAGAARHNIIPLIPQKEFKDAPPPTCEAIERARQEAGKYLDQFRHCKHCRADACGIPGRGDLAQQLYQNPGLETFSHG